MTILCTASQVTLRLIHERDALEMIKEAAKSGAPVCNHYFSRPSPIFAADLLIGLEACEISFFLYEDEEGNLHYSPENLSVEVSDEEGQRLADYIAVDGG